MSRRKGITCRRDLEGGASLGETYTGRKRERTHTPAPHYTYRYTPSSKHFIIQFNKIYSYGCRKVTAKVMMLCFLLLRFVPGRRR
jgi:hypothetical protein